MLNLTSKMQTVNYGNKTNGLDEWNESSCLRHVSKLLILMISFLFPLFRFQFFSNFFFFVYSSLANRWIRSFVLAGLLRVGRKTHTPRQTETRFSRMFFQLWVFISCFTNDGGCIARLIHVIRLMIIPAYVSSMLHRRMH